MEQTWFGTVSLTLGILAIATCIFSFFIFGSLAIVFGGVSYFRKGKNSFGLAGFILGVTGVAIHIALAIFGII